MNPLEKRVEELERLIRVMLKSDRMFLQRDLQLNDGRSILIGQGTGTKIGDASSKIGFYGATPVTQRSFQADLSLTNVSGTGDDGTINANQANTQSFINAIMDDLEQVGIRAKS